MGVGCSTLHTAKSRWTFTSGDMLKPELPLATLLHGIRSSWAAISRVWHFQCLGQRLRSGQRSILEFQYFNAGDLQARIHLERSVQLQVPARWGHSVQQRRIGGASRTLGKQLELEVSLRLSAATSTTRLEGSVDSARRIKIASARKV
ncbi:hypothetical protein FB451DRAFT_1180912 [Mycena latifolia]|nr:hypothetical protein FB451DRAFT_1180912 [Mycena latifolia]